MLAAAVLSRLHPEHRSLARRTPVAMAVALVALSAWGPVAAQTTNEATTGSARTDVSETGLGPVTVKARRLSSGGNGALGERSIRDTPFSLKAIAAEELDQRQVKSVADAFFGDPSVTPLVNDDGIKWSSAGISVRGLSLSTGDSSKLDGLTIVTSFTEWPLETVEQVQLLKGSSGFLYGFGAPGGIVNYVSKRPTDTPLRRVTLGYRSSGVKLGHVDLGGRFGEQDRYGYRLNVVREEGRTYNGSTMDRKVFSLAVDARLTDQLTWEASYVWQDRMLKDANPAFSLGNGVTRAPRTVDGAKDFSVNGSFVGAETWGVRTGLRWRFDTDWTASLVIGRTHYVQDVSFPFATVLNNAGDDSLNGYEMHNLVNSNVVEAMVQGSFSTGPLRHRLVAGISILNRPQDVPRSPTGAGGCGAACTGNLYNSDIGFSYQRTYQLNGRYRYDESKQQALFLSDTVEFSPQWSLLAGARLNDYEYKGFNATGATTSQYKKKPVTPTLALMFKPSTAVTAYGSYVESLEQGSTVGTGYVNIGETLPAMVSKQYELGLKYVANRWAADAALFWIERGTNIDRYVSTTERYLVQDGITRYDGLELGGQYKAAGWDVGGGITVLDATYQRLSPTNSANLGNRAAGVSRLQAVVQGGIDVPAVNGLRLHAGLRYYGDYQNNAANTLEMPGYALAQAGLGYEQTLSGRTITYRAEVKNLTDRKYWSAAGIGSPRTFSLSVSADL